jgi:Flagellar biosynthesis protein, FliO
MSVTTAIEKTTSRRSTRKAAKHVHATENLASSILFSSALKRQTRKHRGDSPAGKVEHSALHPQALRLAALPQNGILSRMFSWFRDRVGVASSKELRLTETVQLGEKRFVAIIHVEGRKFLIGGGTGGVNLLTQLDEPAA